jgi:voltage-dependent potassium channel beta subunit
MLYRRLGRAGIKVSVLSFGSWVTFGQQIGERESMELMAQAYDSGVNFFDNAEVYANGASEILMGKAIKKLAWPRERFLVSTKFFWGIQEGPNLENTLNRKYLLQAIDGSLQRLGLDFVDLAYCHRPDPETPIEETVYAMHDMIDRGKALYWGTSEWPAESIEQAILFAERYGLHRPVVEQPQYNMLWRERVELEYKPLFEKYGLGTTIWSPLASGLLTGKYNQGTAPEGSRGALESYAWLRDRLLDPQAIAKVKKIEPIAKKLGCSMAQLAIAWCAHNSAVSTVILGATRAEQLKENLGALAVLERLQPEIMQELDRVLRG